MKRYECFLPVAFGLVFAGLGAVDRANAQQLPTLPDVIRWQAAHDAPEAVLATSMPDGATNVPLSSVIVTWPDSVGALEGYVVRFGTFSPPPVVARIASASYALPELDPGVRYYLAIDAKNQAGIATGALVAFTTVAAVDCVLSPPTIDPGIWTPTSCTTTCVQTRTETRTRTIVTPPANKGSACGPLVETEDFTRVFTPPPPPPPPPPTVPTTPPSGPVGGHPHGIPNLAPNPTNITVQNGFWSDPRTWSLGHQPTATEVAAVLHTATIDDPFAVAKDFNIYGKLAFLPTVATRLKVGTMTCYPSAELEVGTVAKPVMATAEIVIADRALDLSLQTKDPEQYGTGIIDLCKTTMVGKTKTPFLRLAAEPLAGTTVVTVESVPVGWDPGDVLVFADSRQLVSADYAPRPNGNTDNIRRKQSQSETVAIQSIAGATITLATPLVNSHKGARDPDGVLKVLPHVGNLSRAITVRSENPAGTRGHFLMTGAVNFDVRFAAFEHLGRTTEAMLDLTTYDAAMNPTHIGTNQQGRYPFHLHHVPGALPAGQFQFTAIGNVVNDGRKWGMTVHNSHFGLVQDSVVYDTTGAGIVTEDGSETGNIFDHNFIVKSENSTRLVDPIEVTGGADPFGRKGNGFWFRGIANIVRNNVVADTREGINFSPGSAESGPHSTLNDIRVPKFPGADTSVAGQYTTQQLLRTYNREVSNNEVYSSSQFGVGTWFTEMPSIAGTVVNGVRFFRVPFKGWTIWHFAGTAALYHRYWNGSEDGVTILNEGGVGLAVAQDNFHRTGNDTYSEIKNANIVGVGLIFNRLGQLGLGPAWLWLDGFFRSRDGFMLHVGGQMNVGTFWEFRNPRFAALPGLPLKAFTIATAGPGQDVNNYNKVFKVYGYNGTTENYQLFSTIQAPGAPGPPPSITSYLGGGCAAGLTNQQCAAPPNFSWFHQLATCSATKPEAIGAFTCGPIP